MCSWYGQSIFVAILSSEYICQNSDRFYCDLSRYSAVVNAKSEHIVMFRSCSEWRVLSHCSPKSCCDKVSRLSIVPKGDAPDWNQFRPRPLPISLISSGFANSWIDFQRPIDFTSKSIYTYQYRSKSSIRFQINLRSGQKESFFNEHQDQWDGTSWNT